MTPGEISAVAAALRRDVTGVRALAGGFSHETCLLELGADRVVVRLGGPDPATEAAVMTAAREHAPVPEVLHVLPHLEDEGTRSAMVLEFVSGTPLSQVLGEGDVDEARMRDLGAEVGRVFGRVGRLTFDRPGFFSGTDLAVRDMDPQMKNLPGMAAKCMAATPESRLDARTRQDWTALCAEHAPALERVSNQAHLVHSDANPKNVLVSRESGSGDWRVDALLDWEFSFSGCPYADAANMTRFAADYPPGFAKGFLDGFAATQSDNSNKKRVRGLGPGPEPGAGSSGGLETDWLYLGHVLDMFALSDLVTRPEGHPVADRAAAEIRRWLAEGVPGSAPE